MKNDNNKLLDSIEDVLLKLKEFCDEEELNELRDEIKDCLEDGMTEKSLVYFLNSVASTNLIIKSKKLGISVSEIFEELATYCGSYEEDDFNDAKINDMRENIDFINSEFEEEIYLDDNDDFARIRD